LQLLAIYNTLKYKLLIKEKEKITMKKVFSFFVLIVFLGIGLNIFAQDSHNSMGPAPEGIKLPVSISNDNVTNVNSRGFVYLSTTTHQMAKQFMGNTTLTNIGAPQTYGFPGAFARHTNGTIYCNDQLSPFGLYTIDTTTGAKTLVVNITGITLTNLTGITWDGTQMWGVQSNITQSQIGTINMTSGVFTPVGSPTAVCAGAIMVNAAPNGTLFSVDIVADNLYKWNKTTGIPTIVGALGVNANYGQDGHFDMGDGKYFWAAYTTGPELRIIDTTTGASTVVGAYTGQMSCLAIVPFQTTPPVPTGAWTEQTSGLTSVLYSVSAVNDDVAWICGAAGKVLRTTNKGVTWTNVSGTIPATLALYNIFGWDANTCVVTGVSGTNTSIYQTSNGGTTWTAANTHAGFGDDMFMTDANTAYFIGDPAGGNWDLLKSTNAGLNWATWATLPTTNTAGTYNNAFWQQGNQVWFPNVGLSQMYYSSNMGANWVTQTITLSELTATCFNSPTRGLAGGSSTSPGMIQTTDGGTTWTALTSPFTTSITGISGASTTWWVSTQNTIISKSTNDGTSFATDYTAPAGNWYHMTKSRSGATLWAVRSNGGISRYGQPISGVTPISIETPVNYSLSQNYPNPFNPTTKINFALPKSGLVTLKIYDVAGKEVATLVNEVKNVGTYSVDFNASTLSSGIYFYKVSVNGFNEVKKMMLIK
jgi:photosystem II stability/assembly factor-like uncharacterized protein